jgi:hypothetical protein
MSAGAAGRWLGTLGLLLVLGGCATVKPYDYTNYREHPPRSILVLPPLNQSTSIQGPYSYLSCVTQPLAERGYYVFPVAVIDQYLKENGMPTAGEMHEISLQKVAEIIGADAVLYLTLEQYGSKYQIVSSTSVMSVSAKLVDTRSGLLLWDGRGTAQNASSGSGNILADAVAALITQAFNSKLDAAHALCSQVSTLLFESPDRSLPYGPYSPKYLSR